MSISFKELKPDDKLYISTVSGVYETKTHVLCKRDIEHFEHLNTIYNIYSFRHGQNVQLDTINKEVKDFNRESVIQNYHDCMDRLLMACKEMAEDSPEFHISIYDPEKDGDHPEVNWRESTMPILNGYFDFIDGQTDALID